MAFTMNTNAPAERVTFSLGQSEALSLTLTEFGGGLLRHKPQSIISKLLASDRVELQTNGNYSGVKLLLRTADGLDASVVGFIDNGPDTAGLPITPMDRPIIVAAATEQVRKRATKAQKLADAASFLAELDAVDTTPQNASAQAPVGTENPATNTVQNTAQQPLDESPF